MLTKLEISDEMKRRFWAKVNKTDTCWLWTAAKIGGGYGYFAVLPKNETRGWNSGSICKAAHRVSWIMHNSNIPEGLLVLHKCDNPSCVNPAHLFLGTFRDNSTDMVRKGRQAKGEDNGGGVKLTNKSVKEIRILNKMDFSHATVAKLYGVSRTLVKRIIKRQLWKHI